MKNLLLLSLVVICISCSYDSIAPTLPPNVPVVEVPVRRLYLTGGQSNEGVYPASRLPDFRDTVYGWNAYTFRIEKNLSCNQFLNGKAGGFIIPLARLLAKRHPNDSLYFLQIHQSSTSMEVDWNIHTGAMFFKLVDHLNDLFASHTFDEINFIWVQGEDDAKLYYGALHYRENELALFDYMRKNYGVKIIIDYRLPESIAANIPAELYTPFINAAKDANSKRPDTYLINSNLFDLNYSDHVHLSLDKGIHQFAQACFELLP